MSQFYTVILFDGFDFEYTGRNKEQTIKLIQEEFTKLKRRAPQVEAEWLKHIVFDLCAVYPDVGIRNILLKYCDSGVYYSDESPYRKEEMERDETN